MVIDHANSEIENSVAQEPIESTGGSKQPAIKVKEDEEQTGFGGMDQYTYSGIP